MLDVSTPFVFHVGDGYMFVHVLLLALTQLLTLAAAEYVVYNGKTLEGGEGVCPGDQQIILI